MGETAWSRSSRGKDYFNCYFMFWPFMYKVKTMLYDTEPKLNYILDHPSEFGVANATAFGDGATFAWCNDYHVSSSENTF